MLKVDDARRGGDGWKRVECVSVTEEVPPFQTKPILGRLDAEAVADGAAEPFQLEN